MGFETILYKKDKQVATIVLNRPEAMNALTNQMLEELEGAFKQVMADRVIRALVITGNGRAFCCGADFTLIDFVMKLGPKVLMEKIRYYQSIFTKIEKMQIPVIAAINGYAFGGGLDLALACDIRIATDGTEIGTQYINVAVMPDLGGSQRLPRIVGLGKAKEMMLLGERISAEEAKKIGLISKVVSSPEFELETKRLARKMASGATVAIGWAKKAMNDGFGFGRDILAGLELEVLGQSICLQTEDLLEAIAAFREKRKPEFKGK